MTQKDESPNASEGPYWSEELLAVLVVGLGDETQARETLEGIIQQAQSGRAPRKLLKQRWQAHLFITAALLLVRIFRGKESHNMGR